MKRSLRTLTNLLVVFALLMPIGNMAVTVQNGDETNDVFIPAVLNNDGANPEPVIPETTEVLDQETVDQLISVSGGGSVFTFSNTAQGLGDLETGDVMVGKPSDAAPNGFLRKVLSISSTGGQMVVDTESTTLEDAIQTGAVHVASQLTPDQVSETIFANGVRMDTSKAALLDDQFNIEFSDVVLYDEDGNQGTENDQIVANGSLTLEPGFDFDLVIRNWELEYFYFLNTTKETSELEISTAIELPLVDEEVTVAEYIFSPITIFVGIVPVVFTPELSVNIGVDGNVHVGVSTSVTQEATVSAGLSYEDDTWMPITNYSNELIYNPPSLSAGLELKGYAGAQMSLKLYGVKGPYAAVNAFLRLDADVLENPWWSLYGGLEVPVGVQIEILGHSVEDHELLTISYELLLAQAEDNNQAPDTPFNPYPAHSAVEESITVNLFWYGSDPDGDGLTYDVFFEAVDNTPDILVSDNQSFTTFEPGLLTTETVYYWQIIAQDEQGATTEGPIWTFTTGDGNLNPGEMISIPAGEFQMGCDPDHNGGYVCGYNELPLHNVYIDAYSIHKYEVTNAQYAAFLNTRGSNDCNGTECVDLDDADGHITFENNEYIISAGYENHPVIEVTWYGADAFCSTEGYRLPTEAEWEKAARGPTTQAFPWGDQNPDCSLANYSGCVVDTTEIGSYPTGASPYGILDMSGNVFEFVQDWFQDDYYTSYPTDSWPNNPSGPDSGSYKVRRGGSWSHNASTSTLRTAFRTGTAPGWSDDTIGFRCAVSSP